MTHASRLSVDPTRVCLDCAGSVSGQSKSGRCRRCATLRLNRDPAKRAKAGATLSRTYATCPEVRERHAAGCARGAAMRKADPAKHRVLQAAGRQLAALRYSSTRTAEQRDRDVAARIRKAIPWCPPEHWELNRTLKRTGVKLAERMQIIADQIATEARREVAANQAAMAARHERDRAQSY